MRLIYVIIVGYGATYDKGANRLTSNVKVKKEMKKKQEPSKIYYERAATLSERSNRVESD